MIRNHKYIFLWLNILRSRMKICVMHISSLFFARYSIYIYKHLLTSAFNVEHVIPLCLICKHTHVSQFFYFPTHTVLKWHKKKKEDLKTMTTLMQLKCVGGTHYRYIYIYTHIFSSYERKRENLVNYIQNLFHTLLLRQRRI